MANDDFKKCIRGTNPSEMDCVFLMGFDQWADGAARNVYLEDCRSSKKYSSGFWRVLADDTILFSSLIYYKFNGCFGIGSIATPPDFRRNGFASDLIMGVLKELMNSDPNFKVFLYADIDSKFYEKFGFVALPKEFQRYSKTTCMMLSKNIEDFDGLQLSDVPTYF